MDASSPPVSSEAANVRPRAAVTKAGSPYELGGRALRLELLEARVHERPRRRRRDLHGRAEPEEARAKHERRLVIGGASLEQQAMDEPVATDDDAQVQLAELVAVREIAQRGSHDRVVVGDRTDEHVVPGVRVELRLRDDV